MIDLIIPHYNNQEGLLKTVESIDKEVFNMLIMDDDSAIPPQVPPPFRMIYWPVNCGPGVQRQRAFNVTTEPYVMFLDAGDVFVSKEVQQEIARTIEEHPDKEMFLWPYYYNGTITSIFDNRLHGKIYKREFLNKYGITFCPESSYMNEDIGFNRTCRAILEAKNRGIYYGKTPVIEWIKDENSLTQVNGRENFYLNQTLSLARTSIHTVDILQKNNFDPMREINYITTALYYWFIRILVERPQFKQMAWDGVRLFYKQYESLIDPQAFYVGNKYMKACLDYRNQVAFRINPTKFFEDVINNEYVPVKYGGKDNEKDIY